MIFSASFKTIFFPVAGLLLLSLVAQCSSLSEKEKGAKFKIELECEGNTPIVSRIDTESSKALESGPVTLPENMTCDAAEDLSEKEIIKLKRDGEWKNFHKGTDLLLAKGVYRSSKRDGLWTYYDEKYSAINKTIQFRNGDKDGPEVAYFTNSKDIKYEGTNGGGKMNGIWKYYNASDADCVTTGMYSNDEKTGKWTECTKSAKTGKWYVNFEGTYRQGLRDGPAKHFSSNGSVAMEGSYKADTSKECLDNPPNKDKDNCGKKTGHWKLYFDNGKLYTEGDYSDGRRQGKWLENYKSGEKMAVGTRNHTRSGKWDFFAKSGQILGSFTFNGNDFKPDYAILYENGEKTGEGKVSVGLIKYDQDEDSLLINVKDIAKMGVWKLYTNGVMSAEGEFINGRKHGKWKEKSGGGWKTICYMIGRAQPCK